MNKQQNHSVSPSSVAIATSTQEQSPEIVSGVWVCHQFLSLASKRDGGTKGRVCTFPLTPACKHCFLVWRGCSVIPAPWSPGLYHVYGGVSPCVGLPSVSAAARRQAYAPKFAVKKNHPAYIFCSLILYCVERKVSLDTLTMETATSCRFYWHLPQLAPAQVSVS